MKKPLAYWENSGPVLWVLSLQYYVVQLLVSRAWYSSAGGYSWAHNTISDLGNTRCGDANMASFCSPHWPTMNGSFIILGITMAVGAVLTRRLFAKGKLITIGFGCMAAAGIGALFVGFYPENTIASMHILGAGLSFGLGNIGMLVLAWKLDRLPRRLRAYTLLSGLVGLVALPLFLTQHYGFLGEGAMERLVSYPQTIWMIICGAYLLAQRKNAP